MEGKDGFDAFYQDSYARLVWQLWAVTGSRQAAEDVVQEAFVRAAARWGRVGVYDLPEVWVRRVAIRLASNELRRVRRGLSAPATSAGVSAAPGAVSTAQRQEPGGAHQAGYPIKMVIGRARTGRGGTGW